MEQRDGKVNTQCGCGIEAGILMTKATLARFGWCTVRRGRSFSVAAAESQFVRMEMHETGGDGGCRWSFTSVLN